VAIASEFLILARKDHQSAARARKQFWDTLASEVQGLPTLRDPVFDVVTHPFGEKNLIRVYDGGGNPSVIVKASTPGPDSKATIQMEFQNLQLVHQKLQQITTPPFAVARPLASVQLAAVLYTVESVVTGIEFSQKLLCRPTPPALGSVRADVTRCAEIAVQINQLLRGEASIRLVPPEVWDIPPELRDDSNFVRLWQQTSRGVERTYDSCVQHGDFTIYNIFCEKRGNTFSVVDWGVMSRGLPPLYDLFSFLITVLPAVRPEDSFSKVGSTERERQFLTAFFGNSPWAEFTRELLQSACDRLELRPDSVWPMFVQFLTIRCWFYLWWRSGEREHFLRFLQLLSQCKGKFVL
jgi:hypothetical protein